MDDISSHIVADCCTIHSLIGGNSSNTDRTRDSRGSPSASVLSSRSIGSGSSSSSNRSRGNSTSRHARKQHPEETLGVVSSCDTPGYFFLNPAGASAAHSVIIIVSCVSGNPPTMGMEAAAALGRGDPFTLATASPGGGIELYLQQDDAHHAAAAISAAPETQQQRVGPQGSGAPGVKQPQRHQHQHQRDVRGTQSELTSAAAPQDGNHLQQQQDGRRGPPTEERLRIREKYRERLKERKLQIYQRALEEVIQREKEGSQMQLVFQLQLPTRVRSRLSCCHLSAALLSSRQAATSTIS
ncbi:4-alpha-glucanotransferase family [Cyclospora cayetanensis]|uniref:4-alpha-glucanotransferase family n=1 Tax=Cyclospora cayetanensis TaxID=88456 RepID=A0A1D3DA23_9EIME|nr:4-alpha-glucanotransferase family [Cyclospora cayetanensis]